MASRTAAVRSHAGLTASASTAPTAKVRVAARPSAVVAVTVTVAAPAFSAATASAPPSTAADTAVGSLDRAAKAGSLSNSRNTLARSMRVEPPTARRRDRMSLSTRGLPASGRMPV